MDPLAGLARAAQRGDATAFACLIERIEPDLRRFCVRLAGQVGANDLAQETLLRACRALPSLEYPDRFEPWLFAIAANLARRWWRQQLRWPISLDSLASSYPDVPASAWSAIAPPTASPDIVFEEAEQARALQAALESLPAPLGQVVALHYLDGLDYREVAAALDVPVSTIKGRLFKSRQRLQKELLAAGFPQARRPRKKGSPPMAARKTAAPPAVPPDASLPLEEEVIIESIRMNLTAPTRVIFLKSKTRERFLPIIVGVPEADATAIALQKIDVPRPLTHDLMLSGFRELGASLKRVVVNGQEGETFLAQVYLEVNGQSRVLDARPSDSFALAVRTGAPIFVSAEVFERRGIDTPQHTSSDAGRFPVDLQPTERMQKVMTHARAEMARFGREQIGDEHAFLGMLVEGGSVATRALIESGVDLAAARAAVATVCGFGTGPAFKGGPAEPANPKLKELVEEEVARLGDRWIGTEHLLLALLREENTVVPSILSHLGIEPDTVRQRLMAALTPPG